MSVQIKIYGQPVLCFGKEALVRVRLRQKVDLTGGGLPELELETVLRSEAPLQLQNEQKLELYRNGLLCATAHVCECVRLGEQLYRIRGKPQLEYLQTEFLGAMYEAMPLLQLLDQLLEGRDYAVVDNLNSQTVSGYLPRCNRQEALRQVTVSVGGALCMDEAGKLWLRKPGEDIEAEVLESDRIRAEYPLQLLPEYTCFELGAHSYTRGKLPVELKKQAEYPSGQTVLYFTNPYYNYYTDPELVIYVSEEGPNYAVVEHRGIITLYAYPYIKQTDYHTLPGVENVDYSLVHTVRDVTLVHPGNVEGLLQRMQELGQLRIRATVTCPVGQDSRLLRAGDPVELPTGWGTVLRGYVQKSDLLLENDAQTLVLTIACKEEK